MPNDTAGAGHRSDFVLAAWPALARFLLIFLGVAAAHATLLHLPYFWDEGGYYVPAALDFYHRGTLIPIFTNAHPPLPNVVLATMWRLFGVSILVTRLTACACAAAALLAVFALARRLLNDCLAVACTLLTAVYPIWFVQSSLAHADIFAATFTLAGLAVYFTAPEQLNLSNRQSEAANEAWSTPGRLFSAMLCFCLAVLAKETALLQPVVLACVQMAYAARANTPTARRAHLRWSAVLCGPLPLLALWFAYHWSKTGFVFGNPTFLHYNATANLTPEHIARAFAYRFLHLFWQRDMWVPVALALGCLLLPVRTNRALPALPHRVLRDVALLVAANWIAFSVLGGALLTRYLLPVYPLILLVCLWLWQSRTRYWPALAALTGAAFVSALWVNPPTYFAPEDNLTYRDMILVHQEAIRYLQEHDPEATVLTAWPGAAELTRPELGYTMHPFRTISLEDFSPAQIAQAADEPDRYDVALVFATHYVPPALRRYLLGHPRSRRGQKYLRERDLSPAEIAAALGGQIVWQDDRNGEWAAVLRFGRRYSASLRLPSTLTREMNSPVRGRGLR